MLNNLTPKSLPDTVTQAEFAKLVGKSRAAITQWKTSGRIVLCANGHVDVKASIALLERYRTGGSPVKSDVNLPPSVKLEDLTVNISNTPEQVAALIAASGIGWSIDEARRVKESYLALLNQLEYDIKSGAVVEVARVAGAVGAEYAKVRTRLLAIPSEQAPRLHRLKTAAEIQDALRGIISEALEELTSDREESHA